VNKQGKEVESKRRWEGRRSERRRERNPDSRIIVVDEVSKSRCIHNVQPETNSVLLDICGRFVQREKGSVRGKEGMSSLALFLSSFVSTSSSSSTKTCSRDIEIRSCRTHQHSYSPQQPYSLPQLQGKDGSFWVGWW